MNSKEEQLNLNTKTNNFKRNYSKLESNSKTQVDKTTPYRIKLEKGKIN